MWEGREDPLEGAAGFGFGLGAFFFGLGFVFVFIVGFGFGVGFDFGFGLGAAFFSGLAGALALAEIAACGKPSILIPFPASTHQH